MDQARIENVLKLILVLADSHYMTIKALAERFNTSERTVYRYIDTIREVGFMVKRDCNGVFSIDKSSPKIKDLSDLVYFTEEEACLFNEAIDSIDANTRLKQNLKKKLYSVYDARVLTKVVTNPRAQKNVQSLMKAIEEHKTVVLRDYYSAHGDKKSDRQVEPFAFTTNYVQVWCYESESRTVKMFKVSRIQKVEILEEEWSNQDKHKIGFVDIFRMHSDKPHPIKLKLSVRAANLLLEEYPLSKEHLKKISDNRWMLSTKVCSFEGVGRFIVGLFDDIEILESDELKEFIAAKIEKMRMKIK